MLEMIDKPGFLLVALAGILIFGAKRLPDSARSLGRSMRILKAETKGLHDSGVAAAAAQPTTTTSPSVVVDGVAHATEAPCPV